MEPGRNRWRQGRFSGKCDNCGKTGHKKADCFHLEANKDKRPKGLKPKQFGLANKDEDDSKENDEEFLLGAVEVDCHDYIDGMNDPVVESYTSSTEYVESDKVSHVNLYSDCEYLTVSANVDTSSTEGEFASDDTLLEEVIADISAVTGLKC